MSAEPESVNLLFWEGLARMLNKAFLSSEDLAISHLSIDGIVNPDIKIISASETRIIADSFASEDDGKSYIDYKISISTNAKSLGEFEETFPFKSIQDLTGKLNVSTAKKKVVLNAT